MLSDSDIISSDEKILLDILLDTLLNLESYISCLCRKAGEKINVLNNALNDIHERPLRLIHHDRQKLFSSI